MRAILDAVRKLAPHLVAFYACLYLAALRPEEAAGLAKQNLDLLAKGIHLEKAKPHAGGEWTDTGRDRDDRPLKQREIGETRVVPCPPELTTMLHEHIKSFGTAHDGRLFVGERSRATFPASP